MAEPLVGTDGGIEIDGTAVENFRKWSWDPEAKTAELGGFGSKWEVMKPTRISAKGTCEGIYATGTTGQTAVMNAFVNQTRVVLNLMPDDAATPLSLHAYITTAPHEVNFDDANTFKFDYVQDGEPIALPGH